MHYFAININLEKNIAKYSIMRRKTAQLAMRFIVNTGCRAQQPVPTTADLTALSPQNYHLYICSVLMFGK